MDGLDLVKPQNVVEFSWDQKRSFALYIYIYDLYIVVINILITLKFHASIFFEISMLKAFYKRHLFLLFQTDEFRFQSICSLNH